MLVLPEGYGDYRMVSFDPGLGKCGVSIYDLSEDRRIRRIDAFTLIQERIRQRTGWDEESRSDRALRLRRLYLAAVSVIEDYRPAVVSFEAPFFNRLRPMAFGSLTETTDCLKYAAYDVSRNILVMSVEPMVVKKAVGASKGKGKQVVLEGIERIPEIMDNLIPNIRDLDEHSVDAVGVGYATLHYRKDGYV